MSQYVPEGSFTRTSRNIKSTLYAQAQKRDQSWIPAGLDITNLNSAEVTNLDGFLVNTGNHGAPSGYVPSGSYTKTSREITVILSAECQKRDQSWQYSTLVISNLENVSISNIDGVLTLD
ncbi:cyanovirin [Shewanella salipaludis]|uniref:Cyanovirin n=1 Tax=Shewanella salipaludis TaxID=2723052 RepID=A0A972FQK0_9GAMM|nr:cyanovirin [Shewanella salipaludis]NMH63912.1 cyanovirin [Shewanella salipaludis]